VGGTTGLQLDTGEWLVFPKALKKSRHFSKSAPRGMGLLGKKWLKPMKTYGNL